MIKKILKISCLSFLLFFLLSPGISQAKQAEINFFYSKTCPHCAKAEPFLEGLAKQHSDIQLKKYEISKNVSKLKKFYKKFDVPKADRGLVPLVFIQDQYFLGYNDSIESKIKSCVENVCQGKTDHVASNGKNKVALPIIGTIDTRDFSLPALAVILGFFDGFNVCSLGALVLILGLVLAFRERKKIFLFGGIFILTTAVIYGFLIVLWYQLFSVLSSYLKAMEIVIGLLGIGGAAYFIKEYFRMRKQGPTCNQNPTIANKLTKKIKKQIHSSGSLIVIGLSILGFAAIITIVEFPCSAAIPVMFAGILSQAGLSGLSYVFYIALFVLLYMLDEIIVFLIAVITLNIKGIESPKFIRTVTLVEAVVLLLLGIHYLFGLNFLF